MKSNRQRIANISLDLDNQWSYMKIHGDDGWDSYPSYFEIFIPHVLDILDQLEIKITFFIVGMDTEGEENRKFLKLISEHGHEVGNHSYHHESWLQSYSREALVEEIVKAEESIEQATGQLPKCFRGPGFSWSKELLDVLAERNYIFDASTFPTFLGPLARFYYFWKSDLSKKERKARKELFGKFNQGFRRLKPYRWDLGSGKQITEIPVTTVPFFRIPFHLSYLVYLSNISMGLMKLYLSIALFLCRMTRTPVSFLLHPLDVIGGDQVTQLAFFPGMNVSTDKKVKVFKYVLERLKQSYEVLPMTTFHARYLKENGVKTKKI